MRHVVIYAAAMLLAACDSLVDTTESVQRRRDQAHEADLARIQQQREDSLMDKMCTATPLVGLKKGFTVSLEAKRTELTEAKANLSVEKYSQLSQQLQGYTADWEVLNQQADQACKALALCMARHEDTGNCSQAQEQYNKRLDAVRQFVLEVQRLRVTDNGSKK